MEVYYSEGRGNFKSLFEIASELNQHITGDRENEKFMGRFYYSEQRCI